MNQQYLEALAMLGIKQQKMAQENMCHDESGFSEVSGLEVGKQVWKFIRKEIFYFFFFPPSPSTTCSRVAPCLAIWGWVREAHGFAQVSSSAFLVSHPSCMTFLDIRGSRCASRFLPLLFLIFTVLAAALLEVSHITRSESSIFGVVGWLFSSLPLKFTRHFWVCSSPWQGLAVMNAGPQGQAHEDVNIC